jgi:hypothetical protein
VPDERYQLLLGIGLEQSYRLLTGDDARCSGAETTTARIRPLVVVSAVVFRLKTNV